MSDDMDYSDSEDIDTSSDFEDSSSVDLDDGSVEVEESLDDDDISKPEIDDSTETEEEISESVDDPNDIETETFDDSTNNNEVVTEETTEIEESSDKYADIVNQIDDDKETTENLNAPEMDPASEINESLEEQEISPSEISENVNNPEIAESQENNSDLTDVELQNVGETTGDGEKLDMEIPESDDEFLEEVLSNNPGMSKDEAKELIESLDHSASEGVMGDVGINDLVGEDSAKGNKFTNGIKLGGAIAAGAVDDLICRDTNNWAANEIARSDLDIAQKEHTMIIDTDGNSEMYYDANPGQYEKDVEAMKERRNIISAEAEEMRENDRAEFTGKAIYGAGRVFAKLTNNDGLDHAIEQSRDTIVEGGKMMYNYNRMKKMGDSPPRDDFEDTSTEMETDLKDCLEQTEGFAEGDEIETENSESSDAVNADSGELSENDEKTENLREVQPDYNPDDPETTEFPEEIINEMLRDNPDMNREEVQSILESFNSGPSEGAMGSVDVDLTDVITDEDRANAVGYGTYGALKISASVYDYFANKTFPAMGQTITQCRDNIINGGKSAYYLLKYKK